MVRLQLAVWAPEPVARATGAAPGPASLDPHKRGEALADGLVADLGPLGKRAVPAVLARPEDHPECDARPHSLLDLVAVQHDQRVPVAVVQMLKLLL